jgi:hypothetical protein
MAERVDHGPLHDVAHGAGEQRHADGPSEREADADGDADVQQVGDEPEPALDGPAELEVTADAGEALVVLLQAFNDAVVAIELRLEHAQEADVHR